MASAGTSRQCARCKDNIGSFTCEGCKQMFCAKHCMEHRQELCNRFEQVMTEYNDILQQIQDKQPQNESLKKDLFDRVDQWENSMIEKVHETGEQIRQQLTELINNENILVSNNIQALTDEIRKRHEKEDFLEDDIERIRTSINQVQLEIDKRTEPSNIKLYVEPDPQISLEHLIYVEDKPLRTSFSVINKQSTDKNSNDTEIVPHPDVWQPSNQYPPVPQYIPQYSQPYGTPYIQLSTNGSNTYVMSYPYQIAPSTASNMAPPSAQEKRQRRPLIIVDPVTHGPSELMTSSLSTDTNNISSQTASVNTTTNSSSSNPLSETEKIQKQADFRQQFAKLLSDNSKT